MLKHKRLVSIIATIAFCLSFLAPALLAPAPALAAGNISALRVPVVQSDNNGVALGTVRVNIPAGTLLNNDLVIFTLPDDCEFGSAVALGGASANRLEVPATIGSDTNGCAGILSVVAGTGAAGDTTVQIKATADQNAGLDGVFYLYLGDIDLDDVDGDLTANFDGPTSGFPQGDVVVAKTSDDSELTLKVSDTVTSNNTFSFDLQIREDVAGALKDKVDSLVLTLPDGFEWLESDGATTWANQWGQNVNVTYDVEDEELAIDLAAGADTTIASGWEITLNFEIVDEKDAEPGDVICEVSGKSNSKPDELKVGKYGDFGVKITCDKTPEVFAGKIGQAIGDFTIEETIADSLVDNRYITLSLPSYAKWTKIDYTPGDGGAATLAFAGVAGSNGNVLKYTITDAGSSAGEIDFEDFEVALDVTAPGDLTLTVGGNAGVEDEIVVAKVALPVTMSASDATEVKIGAAAQKIGDLTITEMVAGAVSDDTGDYITLKVPSGCEWAKVPTITVESGDLKLDMTQVRKAKHPGSNFGSYATSDYYQFIIIPVERDSNVASTIKVSDCYVTVDRTVPEGAMTVALLGNAVLESNTYYNPNAAGVPQAIIDGTGRGYTVGTAGMFPQTQAIAGAAAAAVVTPSGEQGRSASFYIGSTIMNVNGANIIMDAAPYIKAGRTYVPVRYLGDALGATTAWDEATKTVTVTKGDKTVVLVIGSTIAKVNGADVQMDVAPEITGVGRTMLPARWVAEGLGYQVGWNAALQQVVIQ